MKWRLLAKKELSLTSAVKESVTTEAIAQEASLPLLQSTNMLQFEPVHQGTMIDDSEQDVAEEDVLQLRASPSVMGH